MIVVPALILVFDYLGLFAGPEFPENTAILMVLGTSLSSIVFTTLSSSIAQWRKKAIDWDIVRAWILYLMGGAFLASFAASALPSIAVKLFIGAFILCVAMVVLFDFSPDPNRTHPGPFHTAILASIGGFISGLAGIGGGNVVVPTLLFFNTQLVRATAAASTLGLAIALAGAAGYFIAGLSEAIPGAIGYIYLPALIPLAISCILFAPLGVHIAHKLDARLLRRTFGLLMVVVAARMVYSAF